MGLPWRLEAALMSLIALHSKRVLPDIEAKAGSQTSGDFRDAVLIVQMFGPRLGIPAA